MGEKGGVRKFKKARGVICHVILDAWVIKNGRVREELPQMERAEAEKVRHHHIYCRGFLLAPGYSQSVIQT